MKLTKDEAVRLHRELWGWLAENPTAEKEDWPQWEYNDGEIERASQNCFCCQYDDDRCGGCDMCPLIWPGGGCDRYDGNYTVGLYSDWKEAPTKQIKTEIARQIRDLPVREDV